MTTSDWEDWLPLEIEESDPSGFRLWYLGCNGLVLKAGDGTTIFIDPYLGTGDPPRTVRMIPVPFNPTDIRHADAILATHEHTDHVHGPSQAPILAGTGATFYGPSASVSVAFEEEWDERWSVDLSTFETVETGEQFDIGEISVTVEAANDPDADQPVSYLFEYEGMTVFHGGDSKPSPVFDRIGREHDVDVGILAFGSIGMIRDKQTRQPKRTKWYNDENEIIEAANALRITQLVPTHWDMWKGLTADPTALHSHTRSFEYPRHISILEIGDRLDVPPADEDD